MIKKKGRTECSTFTKPLTIRNYLITEIKIKPIARLNRGKYDKMIENDTEVTFSDTQTNSIISYCSFPLI